MIAVGPILPRHISSLVIYRETVKEPEAVSVHYIQQAVVCRMWNRMRNSGQTPPDVTFHV